MPSAESKPSASSAAIESATNPQGLSKSQLKKHKKKNRKRKDQALPAGGENDEDKDDKPTKEEQGITVIDDIVIIPKEEAAAPAKEERLSTTQGEQPSKTEQEEEGQTSGKAKKKKNKKKKKKAGEEQLQLEDHKQEQTVGDGAADVKEAAAYPSNARHEGPPRQSKQQATRPEIVVSPPSPERARPDGPSEGQAAQQPTFPKDSLSHSRASTGLHRARLGERPSQASLQSQDEDYNDLYGELLDKSPAEAALDRNQSRREKNELEMRRSLLHSTVHPEKYPEEGLHDKIIASSDHNDGGESDPDAEFPAFAAEFDQDEDLKMFKADAGPAVVSTGVEEQLIDSTTKKLGARREEAAQLAAEARSRKARYNNTEVMEANAGMLSDFASLHDQVKFLGEQGRATQ